MEEDDSSNNFNKGSEFSITKYSKDLLKRSLKDLEKAYSIPNKLLKKQRILLIAKNDFGDFLISELKAVDFEIKTHESSDQLDIVYFELSCNPYEIIILSDTTLCSASFIQVVPEIKIRFPNIRIIILVSETQGEFINEIYNHGIDAFLTGPVNINSLKNIIINKKSSLPPFIIERTKTTPKISFNASNGILVINGRSEILDVCEFYHPVFDWLYQYRSNPFEQTKMIIQMENINTCTSMDLLNIFKIIECIQKQNSQVIIYWYYELGDEEIHETGQDYESVIRVPFKMVPYKGNNHAEKHIANNEHS
jgi:hypothetical protein